MFFHILKLDRSIQFTEQSLMEVKSNTKTFSKGKKRPWFSIKPIVNILLVLVFLFLFHIQASPFYASTASASYNFFNQWKGTGGATNHSRPSDELELDALASKLRDSVTFLPLKDIRFKDTPMTGHTWFMSSLNDTYEENEAEYLHFPSPASKGRILCIKGRDKRDGAKNSYALAWPGSLPDSAILMSGLTFVSDTYYTHENLWHGICAMAPFVGWSLRNQCVKPTRWVLFHWGELRVRMGSWLQNIVRAKFGEVKVEGFENGDGPHCFEEAVVARHDFGRMGKAKKLEVFELFRCKAREFCGIDSEGKGKEVNESGGPPIIRLTLLMRRGPRSFKNSTAVIDIFARECAMVEGCQLKVIQSENLSFCDQVRVMTYTDIVASPHGAQLTNMFFMDNNSSVMEFFPKGWRELAGVGQYAHHWLADLSGMNHRGAWWEPIGEEKCPFSPEDPQCFLFFKDGMVGHNETFFAEWARRVLNQVRISKREQASKSLANKTCPNACVC